jgi:hypothetical protein
MRVLQWNHSSHIAECRQRVTLIRRTSAEAAANSGCMKPVGKSNQSIAKVLTGQIG